jgi:hypothetical protein
VAQAISPLGPCLSIIFHPLISLLTQPSILTLQATSVNFSTGSSNPTQSIVSLSDSPTFLFGSSPSLTVFIVSHIISYRLFAFFHFNDLQRLSRTRRPLNRRVPYGSSIHTSSIHTQHPHSTHTAYGIQHPHKRSMSPASTHTQHPCAHGRDSQTNRD